MKVRFWSEVLHSSYGAMKKCLLTTDRELTTDLSSDTAKIEVTYRSRNDSKTDALPQPITA